MEYGEVRDETGFIVQVTNTGKMGSDCVVMGFITSDDPDSPNIKLFDFQRVYVDVGQSVNATLSKSPFSISITNSFGHERVLPGNYKLFLGDYHGGNFVQVDLCIDGKEYSIFDYQRVKEKWRQKEIKARIIT